MSTVGYGELNQVNLPQIPCVVTGRFCRYQTRVWWCLFWSKFTWYRSWESHRKVESFLREFACSKFQSSSRCSPDSLL